MIICNWMRLKLGKVVHLNLLMIASKRQQLQTVPMNMNFQIIYKLYHFRIL